MHSRFTLLLPLILNPAFFGLGVPGVEAVFAVFLGLDVFTPVRLKELSGSLPCGAVYPTI